MMEKYRQNQEYLSLVSKVNQEEDFPLILFINIVNPIVQNAFTSFCKLTIQNG